MLSVTNLSVTLPTGTRLLRGLDLNLASGETLGLVGESGSGKSMTALAIMGLLPRGLIGTGDIRFEGQDLLALDDHGMSALRGRQISMVFQEPMSALNPVHTVGAQIAEPLILHGIMDDEAAQREALRLLDRVGIDRPEARLNAYPHELSGGQRQRVMIAMAIACRPALLIADEPTSALDATVQGEILDLLRDLQQESGMAMLFISHDLKVIARVARRMMVLYGGAAMEAGETATVLAAPRHPYTQGLLNALPHGRKKGDRLQPIPGHVPPPHMLAKGCPFSGRCPKGDARCAAEVPPILLGDTAAACFHAGPP